MTRWRLIFCCALVLVAAGVVALWPSGPKEPEYEGLKLSIWIGFGNNEFTNTRIKARAAINAVATDALPYLMNEFTVRESRLTALRRKLFPQDLNAFEKSQEIHTRHYWATLGLYYLGTNTAAVLPTLAKYLKDQERFAQAAYAMSGCGDMALPYQLNAPFTTNNQVNGGLIVALGNIAQQNESAISRLIELTRHTNDFIRETAIGQLTLVRGRNDLVMPALIKLLSDGSMSVRITALTYLPRMGAQAQAAIPALLAIMQEGDSILANRASNAIHQIDPTALPRAAAP